MIKHLFSIECHENNKEDKYSHYCVLEDSNDDEAMCVFDIQNMNIVRYYVEDIVEWINNDNIKDVNITIYDDDLTKEDLYEAFMTILDDYGIKMNNDLKIALGH